MAFVLLGLVLANEAPSVQSADRFIASDLVAERTPLRFGRAGRSGAVVADVDLPVGLLAPQELS
jgi:hypothetical protein